MSGGSRKRAFSNIPSQAGDNDKVKIHKEGGQSLNRVSESVAIQEQQDGSCCSCMHEMHPSQVNEQTVGEEVQVIDPIPNEPNFSNQLKNIAQINFNAELLKKLRQFIREEGSTTAVEELCIMIEQRKTLIENQQCKYSQPDQCRFNNQLRTRLQNIGYELDPTCSATDGPDTNFIFQELIDMLRSDNERYPGEPMCPFVGYVSDLDLLECIASDNSDSAGAQLILRARNLHLTRLALASECDKIAFELSSKMDAGGLVNFRRSQYGMKVNKMDPAYMFRLLQAILRFYNVTEAVISLKNNGNSSAISYESLISTFGAPPTDEKDKFRIGEMIIWSAGLTRFLRWFFPRGVRIHGNPAGLLNEPNELIISNVDLIMCCGMNVDRLIERCTNGVLIEWNSTWSKESIFSVLTDHSRGGPHLKPRKILYRCHHKRTGSRTTTEWEELLQSWCSKERESGKYKRTVEICLETIDETEVIVIKLR